MLSKRQEREIALRSQGASTNPVFHSRRKITPEIAIAIKEKRLDGVSIWDLALEYKVSANTIRNYI